MPTEDQIKFKHFSFQEYFCSQEIYSKKVFRDNLTNWIGESWWTDVLFFSAGSIKNIDDYCDIIVQNSAKDRFTAGLAVGGMLQAAYETSVINKRKVISSTLDNISYIIEDVVVIIREMSDNKLPRFIPYALVVELLSDNYSSSYLETPLKEELERLKNEGDHEVTKNLFIAMSMAKSGNINGLLEFSTSPDINDPISLLLSDMMLDEYESRYNNGKITPIHKTIMKKIKHNSKAIKYLISPTKI